MQKAVQLAMTELRTALPCEVCGERTARVRDKGRICLVCMRPTPRCAREEEEREEQ
jgi:hypothetical protein